MKNRSAQQRIPQNAGQEKQSLVLRGVAAHSKSGAGLAYVVPGLSEEELQTIPKGCILVTVKIDPRHYALASTIAGLVTELGGLTSHGAILAREADIPAIVGVQKATEVIQSGDHVLLDGRTGKVTIQVAIPERISALEIPQEPTFRLFGYDLPVVQDGEQLYVLPRPEMVNSPFSFSFIAHVLERIPDLLRYTEVQPLVSHWYQGRLAFHLERTKAFVKAYSEDLLSHPSAFTKRTIARIHQSYSEVEKANEALQEYHHKVSDLSEQTLLQLFRSFWDKYGYAMAPCFFLPCATDDILWPEVQKRVALAFPEDERKVAEVMQTFVLPVEQNYTAKLNAAIRTLLSSANECILEILTSSTSAEEKLARIRNVEDGEAWLNNELSLFIRQWGWLTDRELLYPPLDSPSRMVTFISLASETPQPGTNLPQNQQKVEQTMREVQSRLDQEKSDHLETLLHCAQLLSLERDNHHYILVRHQSYLRPVALEMGKRLRRRCVLQDSQDVFFLFLPETFAYLEGKDPEDIAQIQQVIQERISNYCTWRRIERDW